MTSHAAEPCFTYAAPCQPAKRRPSGDYAGSGSAPPRAGNGNSPRGREPGQRPSHPFHRPPASKPRPSKRPQPQWLTPGLAHPPTPPPPPPSSLPAGGQPIHPCSGLGDSASKLLGCSGDQVGVSSALVFSQGSPLHLSPYLQASWESSCLGDSGSGGHFIPLQRCHWGGGLSFVPGVLRESICGAQGFRRVETSAGSLPPPWIFTRVTRELCLHARARGIRLRVCLDEWLVLTSAPELCSTHKRVLLHTDNTMVACYINKQRGASDALAVNGGASSVVCQSVHSIVSPVCSRQIKHSSRPPWSTTHSPAVGMDSRACSAQASLVSLVHTSHWPRRHSEQSVPASVCVPSSRPGSLRGGRSVHSLVKSPVLCLPPNSHHRESSQKGTRRKGHPHSSIVAPHWPAQAWFIIMVIMILFL